MSVIATDWVHGLVHTHREVKMTQGEFNVLCCLAAKQHPQSGVCQVSECEIATLCRLSKTHAARCLRALKKIGALASWEEGKSKFWASKFRFGLGFVFVPLCTSDPATVHILSRDCAHLVTKSGTSPYMKTRETGETLPPLSAMLEEFEIKDSHRTLARELGLDAGVVFAKLRDFCLATGKRYENLDAALNLWLRNERAPRASTSPKQSNAQRAEQVHAEAERMLDEMIAEGRKKLPRASGEWGSTMEERQRLSRINKMVTDSFAFINKPCPDAKVTLAWSDQLSVFSDEQIAGALDRAVRECEWLTFAAILERVLDGRPEPETAWATCPKSEEDSIVWTEEMSAAFGVARLHGGNEIAGRMAFLEAYKSEVGKARLALRPVRWSFSAGSDRGDRVRALAEGLVTGRIDGKHAISLAGEQANELRLALPETERKRLLLDGDAPEIAQLPEHLRGFAALRDALPKALTETKRPARIEVSDEERAEHRKRVREQAVAIARRAEEERQRAIADKLLADPFVDPPVPPISRRRPHRRRRQ